MTNIFQDTTYSAGQSIGTMYEREPYMRAKQDATDLFYNEAQPPGCRKYPMDVQPIEPRTHATPRAQRRGGY